MPQRPCSCAYLAEVVWVSGLLLSLKSSCGIATGRPPPDRAHRRACQKTVFERRRRAIQNTMGARAHKATYVCRCRSLRKKSWMEGCWHVVVLKTTMSPRELRADITGVYRAARRAATGGGTSWRMAAA